jgi:hypothetical protein
MTRSYVPLDLLVALYLTASGQTISIAGSISSFADLDLEAESISGRYIPGKIQ